MEWVKVNTFLLRLNLGLIENQPISAECGKNK